METKHHIWLKKEKLLVTSNFSFSYNVFYSYISLVHQNGVLCGNGLRNTPQNDSESCEERGRIIVDTEFE